MSSSTAKALKASGLVGVGSGPGNTVAVNHLNSALSFVLNVTAQAGTNPTLDVDIEVLDEVSGLWYVLDSFAQKTGVSNERLAAVSIPEGRIRANWTIGGTDTPTFTFSVSVNGKTN
jgi:hypothetical protein